LHWLDFVTKLKKTLFSIKTDNLLNIATKQCVCVLQGPVIVSEITVLSGL